jgi:hypothetical protein
MKNTSNIRIVGGQAPSRLLQPTSEARLRLAKLIDRRLGLEDSLHALAEAGEVLIKVQGAEAEATAALAALEAAEAAAMGAWSQSPTTPMPISNPVRRDELLAAIRTAAAQASAARKAAAANGAEQQRDHAALKALEPLFAVTIAEIIDEQMTPLLADFAADKGALAAKAARIQEGVEALTVLAHSVGVDKGRLAFTVLEKLNGRKHTAFAPLAPDTDTGSQAKWLALVGRLRADPLATLED